MQVLVRPLRQPHKFRRRHDVWPCLCVSRACTDPTRLVLQRWLLRRPRSPGYSGLLVHVLRALQQVGASTGTGLSSTHTHWSVFNTRARCMNPFALQLRADITVCHSGNLQFYTFLLHQQRPEVLWGDWARIFWTRCHHRLTCLAVCTTRRRTLRRFVDPPICARFDCANSFQIQLYVTR